MHFHFEFIERVMIFENAISITESFVHVDTNRKIYNLIDVHRTAKPKGNITRSRMHMAMGVRV